MNSPHTFLQSLVDSLRDQIAVIDRNGEIIFVNKSWKKFSDENGISGEFTWLGENYINVCRKAAKAGDLIAADIVSKLEHLINGEINECEVDYPCHSPKQKRWFTMRATPVKNTSHELFVISHRDVTRRILAEKKAERLSLEDALCGLPNRRKFEQVMKEEWRRHKRSKFPISIIMIDIDFFKSYNDDFGHIEGDVCLKVIGKTLTQFVHRAGDLAARIGGEEFAIILSGTGHSDANKVAENVRITVESLSLESGLKRQITVSLGVATAGHGWLGNIIDFMRLADEGLYEAKHNGRNQVYKVPLAS